MDLRKLSERQKVEIGIILIILNFAIGFVSKIPFLQLVRDPNSFHIHPLYYISAVVAYIFSWFLGIIGVLLLGKETYQALRRKMQKKVGQTIHHHVGRHVEKHVKPHVDKFVQDVERMRRKRQAEKRMKARLKKQNEL
ncbi:hypothetical protein J4227_05860 [Candidatus Woesearchaeota archaeon]|nr:hypothetical protein [Candidatus Woesearchaeota archaeon]